MTIADRIKYYRNLRGLTQTELAQRAGVQFSAISKYELGTVSNIPIDRIGRLADALDVTPGILLGIEEDTIDPCMSEIHNKLVTRLLLLDDDEKAVLLQMADQMIKLKERSSSSSSI